MNFITYLYLPRTTATTLVSWQIICLVRGEVQPQFRENTVAHASVSQEPGR